MYNFNTIILLVRLWGGTGRQHHIQLVPGACAVRLNDDMLIKV